MTQLQQFLLGLPILALCFVHPLFIIIFAFYLIYVSANNPNELTLHGQPLDGDLPPLELFIHKKSTYLQSAAWHQKRSLVLARDRFACTYCGRHTDLNVHHIRYSNTFNEPLADLLTLCSDCHHSLHDRVGYPQTYNDYMTKDYK